MSNNEKIGWISSQMRKKIRILIFGEIFEIVNIYQRLTCNTKQKLGGAILKSLSFATECADFDQIFLKVMLLQSTKSQDF